MGEMGLDEQTAEFAAVAKEFTEFRQQMNNPVVVGALLNRLSEERRDTNLLFKEINAKLDKIAVLEERIRELEAKLQSSKLEVRSEKPLSFLSDVDGKIMEFVSKAGKCCAEDLQREFNYKGRNAASSRLNALWKQGLLDKKYAGKTVFFVTKSTKLSQ